MRPGELVLRGYAERCGDVWMAVCLDFSLAAQGDSFAEARRKLDAQVHEYVYDVLVGQDRAHAAALLTRRAPAAYWLRYWRIKWQSRLAHALGRHGPRRRKRFKDVMPLAPAHC